MASQISICNNALSEIAAERINAIDEDSLSAAECYRVWPSLIAEYATWADWQHAKRRVTLALEANDRLGEWAYRYAVPAGMAKPLRIIPLATVQQSGLPSAGPFTLPYIASIGAIPYLLAGDSIYSNLENAVLEYQSNDIDLSRIGALEARAIELELASRISVPIKKNRELKGDMVKQAELARQRAVAECENASPKVQPNYISPVEWAREGMIDGLGPGRVV